MGFQVFPIHPHLLTCKSSHELLIQVFSFPYIYSQLVLVKNNLIKETISSKLLNKCGQRHPNSNIRIITDLVAVMRIIVIYCSLCPIDQYQQCSIWSESTPDICQSAIARSFCFNSFCIYFSFVLSAFLGACRPNIG